MGPMEGIEAALMSGSYSENHVDAQQNQHKEPTYEIIPPDTARTPHTLQGTETIMISCDQNPAYVRPLGVCAKESFKSNDTCCDCSQNPTYGIH